MFILLVEDDAFYANMILELLKQNGFNDVKHFDNGLECLLQVYEEKVPDLVIMDHQLGLVNGVEVLQKIRAYKPDLKVVFMSGQKDVKVAVQSMKKGAMDYITKDENAFTRLLAVLRKVESDIVKKTAEKPIKKMLSGVKKFLSDTE
jgi:polysaccharide export outer membrane protein